MTSEQYSQTFRNLKAAVEAGECAEFLLRRNDALMELTGGRILRDLERATGTEGRAPMVEAYKASRGHGLPVVLKASPEEADRLVRWCWANDVHIGSVEYAPDESVISGPRRVWEVRVDHG